MIDKDLEAKLKNLLETILTVLEKFIQSKEEVEVIESKLHDYDQLTEIVDMILQVFDILKNKFVDSTPNKVSQNEEKLVLDYQKLEKILQKYEKEIRKHIATEQQLRICAESFQQKLEETERELQKYQTLNSSLTSEVNLLQKRITIKQTKEDKKREEIDLKRERDEDFNEEKKNIKPIIQKQIVGKLLSHSGVKEYSPHDGKKGNEGLKRALADLNAVYLKPIKACSQITKEEINKEKTCPNFFAQKAQSNNLQPGLENNSGNKIGKNLNSLKQVFKITSHKRSKSYNLLPQRKSAQISSLIKIDKEQFMRNMENFMRKKV